VVNESCHTYERVTSENIFPADKADLKLSAMRDVGMSRIQVVNESCHAYE